MNGILGMTELVLETALTLDDTCATAALTVMGATPVDMAAADGIKTEWQKKTGLPGDEPK